MSQDSELLTEIRDLLRVMAEPALAERDATLRAALREVIGGSAKAARAALLMDGLRSQSTIAKESGMDASNLSKLVKKLANKKLLADDQKQPRLLVSVPPSFFHGGTDGNANE